MCTESADGMWHPVRIFLAIGEALEKKPIEDWAPPKDLDTSSHGLDEAVIAEALAADCIRPYWRGRRTVAMESIIRCASDVSANTPSVVVISDQPDAEGDLYPPGRTLAWAETNPAVQRAARTVVDARLARLRTGPRGGWSKAALDWLAAARITGPLERIDDDAIGFLGRMD